ncbi:MAG: glycosyltransferase [Halochromatium sp.]
MRIAIVHFHLQTGGVTRVIQHACAALAAAGHRVAVLCGEPPRQPEAFAARLAVIPALGYEERRAPLGPDALGAAMARAARRALGGAPDLWHIHNHCLGKNLALPGAVRGLAEAGQPLLLQPHDFAEDGRPALYRRMLEVLGGKDGAILAARIYPLAPHIHYATLNARDDRFLAAAGVPDAQRHRLPNAASFATEPLQPPRRKTRVAPGGTHMDGERGAKTDRPSGDVTERNMDVNTGGQAGAEPAVCGLDHRRWLYPCRAIRRKNLGELLFWATLAGPEDRFATTQAPQNPLEQPIYARWVALAAELALPVDFALGARCGDFAALLASSHALISTSVGEGFGLAFLEPWLIDRPLAGRDLPEITADFAADGLDLGALYQRLPVPLEWLDAAALRQRMDAALAAATRAYGRAREREDLARAWAAAVDHRDPDRIDFGRLDEEAQIEVLRHLRTDPAARSALDITTPPLMAEAERMAHNRAIVEREYMLDGYRRRLEAIYRALLAAPSAPVRDQADGQALIARFQAPERLFLLRT